MPNKQARVPPQGRLVDFWYVLNLIYFGMMGVAWLLRSVPYLKLIWATQLQFGYVLNLISSWAGGLAGLHQAWAYYTWRHTEPWAGIMRLLYIYPITTLNIYGHNTWPHSPVIITSAAPLFKTAVIHFMRPLMLGSQAISLGAMVLGTAACLPVYCAVDLAVYWSRLAEPDETCHLEPVSTIAMLSTSAMRVMSLYVRVLGILLLAGRGILGTRQHQERRDSCDASGSEGRWEQRAGMDAGPSPLARASSGSALGLWARISAEAASGSGSEAGGEVDGSAWGRARAWAEEVTWMVQMKLVRPLDAFLDHWLSSLDSSLVLALLCGPVVAYAWIDSVCKLILYGDHDERSASAPLQVIVAMTACSLLGRMDVGHLVGKVESAYTLLEDLLPRHIVHALLSQESMPPARSSASGTQMSLGAISEPLHTPPAASPAPGRSPRSASAQLPQPLNMSPQTRRRSTTTHLPLQRLPEDAVAVHGFASPDSYASPRAADADAEAAAARPPIQLHHVLSAPPLQQPDQLAHQAQQQAQDQHRQRFVSWLSKQEPGQPQGPPAFSELGLSEDGDDRSKGGHPSESLALDLGLFVIGSADSLSKDCAPASFDEVRAAAGARTQQQRQQRQQPQPAEVIPPAAPPAAAAPAVSAAAPSGYPPAAEAQQQQQQRRRQLRPASTLGLAPVPARLMQEVPKHEEREEEEEEPELQMVRRTNSITLASLDRSRVYGSSPSSSWLGGGAASWLNSLMQARPENSPAAADAGAAAQRHSRCSSSSATAPFASQLLLQPPQQQHLCRAHSCVTVLFADIVGFTPLSSQLCASQVFDLLNRLFSEFDALTSKHDVYKVETVGDCYMCATGLNAAEGDTRHAADMVRFAQDMLRVAAGVMLPVPEGRAEREAATAAAVDGGAAEAAAAGPGHVRLRIGIHSGSVMSGVVGTIRKRYVLIGDTVNTASRMESTGLPDRINLSPWAHDLACDHLADEMFECRGEIPIKGKGLMTTWLVRQQDAASGGSSSMQGGAHSAPHLPSLLPGAERLPLQQTQSARGFSFDSAPAASAAAPPMQHGSSYFGSPGAAAAGSSGIAAMERKSPLDGLLNSFAIASQLSSSLADASGCASESDVLATAALTDVLSCLMATATDSWCVEDGDWGEEPDHQA